MRRLDSGTAGRAAKASKASRDGKPKRSYHPSPSHDDRLATTFMAPRSVPLFGPKVGSKIEKPAPAKKGWGTQAIGPTRPAPRPKYNDYTRGLGRVLGADLEHQQRTQISGFTGRKPSRRQRIDNLIDEIRNTRGDPSAAVRELQRMKLSKADRQYISRASSQRGEAAIKRAQGPVFGAAETIGSAIVGTPTQLVKSARDVVHGTAEQSQRAWIENFRRRHGRDPTTREYAAGAPRPKSEGMIPWGPIGGGFKGAWGAAKATRAEAKAVQRATRALDLVNDPVEKAAFLHHPERKRLHDIIDANAPETGTKRKWSRQQHKDSHDNEIIRQAWASGQTPAEFLDRARASAARTIEGFERAPTKEQMWENIRRGPGGDLHAPVEVQGPKAWRTVGGQKVQVLGKMTPAARARRAVAVMQAKGLSRRDLLNAAHWYESVHPTFEAQLPERAQELLRGFTVSQANQSPKGGLRTVLDVLTQIAHGTKPEELEGGTGSLLTAIHTAVGSGKLEKGMAAKLHDFADSIEGRQTRTWMGGFAHGGSPYAADVHMIRAEGGIDPKHANQLLNPRENTLFKKGFTPDELGLEQKVDKKGNPVFREDGSPVYKTEFAGSPSDRQYWQMVENGHKYANHLNEIRFLGKRDWTPAQAQAMDWAVSQWLHGVDPADLAGTFEANVRTITAPATAKAISKVIKKAGGVVHSAEDGVVVAYTGPMGHDKIGQALADKYGGATATWLSNRSKANHRLITIAGDVTEDVTADMIERGFTHAWKAGDNTIFMASNQAVPKRGFDQAVDALTERGLTAEADITEAAHYGTAAKTGQVLGGVGGYPRIPGTAAGRVSRGVRAVAGTSSEGLGSGPLFGFERGGDRGLIPDLVERLRGGEEVPKTPGEQVYEALPAAKRGRQLQEKGYSEEWGRRVAAGAEKLETMGGTPEAFEAAINELRGELPKLRYDKLRKLDQAAVEGLTKQISEHPDLQFFERIRTYKALHAALEGRYPQKNQIKLLEKVFGPDTTKTIKDAAVWSQKMKALGIEIWNMPRALASSFDLSAPFRQALVIGAGHPIIFFKNFAPMVRSFGSERYYDEVMRAITEDVNYGRMEIGGLDLTDLENIATREESRKGGQLAENIESRLTAGKLRPVRASGRAYTAFLNKMRADTFNQILDVAQEAGRDIDDPEFLKQIGSLLNAASGRGNLLFLEKHATLLNGIFFSPKLAASRVEMLARTANLANPRSTIDPILKRETAKMMAGVTTFVGGLLGLVELSGAGTVNFNPTNADFLKIKIGDTRIDPLGGFQQYIRLAAQLKRGEITYSGTDETVPKSQLESLKRFGRGKVSPQMGATLDILAHQKFPERTPINTWGQRAITAVQAGAPLTPADVVKYAKHTHDPLGTAGIALVNTLGISTQTYPPHDAAADLRKRSKQFTGREPDPRAVKEAEEKSVLDAKLTNVDNYKDRLQITADYLSDLGDDSGQRYVRHARSEPKAEHYYHHLRDKMFRHLERENRHLNHLEDRAVERNGSH